MKSTKLLRAKINKNDEFYTQYADIKSECDNYMSHFFNKIIYCNCDTKYSAFVKYFTELKRQKIIKDIWFSGGIGGEDFRTKKSEELLKKADLIITNPPFSLFKDFIDLLVKHDKKFLIIGNKNAIAYKNVFTLIKSNKIWFGTRKWAGGMIFLNPDLCIKAVPAVWFTNLKHNHHPEPLVLTKAFNKDYFLKYENANAINVDKTSDIPKDYYGTIGVPITFMEKYNPQQFKILGLDKDFTYDNGAGIVQGRRIYSRIFIRKISCES